MKKKIKPPTKEVEQEEELTNIERKRPKTRSGIRVGACLPYHTRVRREKPSNYGY